MKYNLHVIGRKAAGSLRTMSDVGNSVLSTVRAIADVTGHPVASYAVEGIRRGVNVALPDVLNYAEGKSNNIGSYQEMSVVTPATGSAPETLGIF